jgi:SPP1 family phage portal protein
MVIKGYGGVDNQELMDNLRYYKLVKVDEGGGVDTIKQDIPIEAFNEFANRIEENIFLFGQGVNVKSDKFGNAASGIALKFMFAMNL